VKLMREDPLEERNGFILVGGLAGGRVRDTLLDRLEGPLAGILRMAGLDCRIADTGVKRCSCRQEQENSANSANDNHGNTSTGRQERHQRTVVSPTAPTNCQEKQLHTAIVKM